MDSSNAEKATSLEELRMTPAERIMFTAGRASRDAEVAELTSRLRWDVAAARVEAFTTESDTFRARGEALVKQISELRAAFGDSEARRAELEAAIQAVRDLADKAEHGALRWADPLPVPEWVPRVRSVLSAPSVVLEDRDRENRAIGWAEALNHVWELNDPAYTFITDTDSIHPILTRADVDQALTENPYRGESA